MDDYFRLWLGYDLVSANQRDRVPGFAGLRDKLAEETRVFLDRVVHTDKGGLRAAADRALHDDRRRRWPPTTGCRRRPGPASGW